MSKTIFLLGGAQTDFARSFSREGIGIDGIMQAAIETTLEATVAAEDIDVIHVGNFIGELCSRQGQLNGLVASVCPALAGKPSARHEAACASGSIAILSAMAELEAERYETALVLGVEQLRNVSGERAAEFLGVAAWTGHEAQEAKYLWPYQFEQLTNFYEERFALDRSYLRAIARMHFSNAKKNPFAQTRNWTLTDAHFSDDDERNPRIEGKLRKQDCSQVTDGAVGIVLATESAARRYAQRKGIALESLPRILGWGHSVGPMSLEEKLRIVSTTTKDVFPYVTQASRAARKRAGLGDGIEGIDAVELHDCFSITAYTLLEALRLAPPGEGFRAIEQRTIEPTGTCPVNLSGGLLGAGHPVGATGVRMVLDAMKQVTGTAGAMQREGARRVQTMNIGGSATTAVSFVVGR